ncbi:hypothetical protein KKF55_03860 [Patescibacteria group bacterium]|nr:hypothetical protein [Patescibacteria group bacterium]
MISDRFTIGRTTVSALLVTVVSLLIPSLFSVILEVATPRFFPEQLSLPSTAQEVVSKRSEKTATFEIEPGEFAQVSGIEWGISPKCQSKLCSAIEPIRSLLPSVFATTTGPNSPGTMTNVVLDGSNDNWDTVDGATAEGGSESHSIPGQGVGLYSDYLQATNFGFSIPANSTINGIAVEIKRSAASWAGIHDLHVRIVKSGIIQSSVNRAKLDAWPDTSAYATYGGVDDVWGESWTNEDIDSGFGAAVAAIDDSAFGVDIYVDHVRIIVYYTEAVAEEVPFFSWWSIPFLIAGLFLILWKEDMFTNHLTSI